MAAHHPETYHVYNVGTSAVRHAMALLRCRICEPVIKGASNLPAVGSGSSANYLQRNALPNTAVRVQLPARLYENNLLDFRPTM